MFEYVGKESIGFFSSYLKCLLLKMSKTELFRLIHKDNCLIKVFSRNAIYVLNFLTIIDVRLVQRKKERKKEKRRRKKNTDKKPINKKETKN